MSRHQYDLRQCLNRPGPQTGMLCSSCDGKCPVCDSFVSPTVQVRVCDGCVSGNLASRCILCSNHLGDDPSPAYYCSECVLQEKHREGCPRIVNLGTLKTDMRFKKK